MATVTGLTAVRMLAIEDSSIVDGRVENGNLILIQHDGTEINVGSLAGPAGPEGPQGPPGISAIPGEVRLWANNVPPVYEDYGTWVWANGGIYPVADHPIAAGNISSAWKTFDGASDPGPGNFRVPDMRGLVAAGMDQMPSGTRANRMTRAAAITLAAKTGQETHVLTIAELASHSHTVNSHSHTGQTTAAGNHSHLSRLGHGFITPAGSGDVASYNWGTQGSVAYSDNSTDEEPAHQHGIYSESPGTNAQGSNNSHETVQPTVMVPYIVNLDGPIGGS